MMLPEDWAEVVKSYEILKMSNITKLESVKWIMYKVGTTIRLDIR